MGALHVLIHLCHFRRPLLQQNPGWILQSCSDAIFTVRQMQEKYGCKGKKLYFALVDLEIALDRVPREVTRWALRKAGVKEWLVNAVMTMYAGAQTVVRTTEGDSKAFNAKVGLH